MRRVALVCGLGLLTFSLQAQSNAKIPITTRSDSARQLFLRGRALNETLKPHEAHDVFVKAVAADPDFAFGEYSIASTAPTSKEVTEHLQRAVALSSRASLGERLIILGMQARRNADRTLARQLAESLVTAYPGDERAHLTLASVYSAQQLYPKSIAEYERAIALNPDYSLAYNQLGYANRSVGNNAAAEDAFKRYIALLPNDPNPRDSYAELLMKVGRFDESIAQYQKALSVDPHFSGSFVGIASDQMHLGKHSAAIAELDAYYKQARDDNERRTALINQAMVFVDQGATDKAIGAMDRARMIATAAGDTANLAADDITVGDILLDARRAPEARERYRRGHALLAGSGATADVKADDALGRHYDLARLALAAHDLPSAKSEASACLRGAVDRKNDVRIRQAHYLDALVAITDGHFDAAILDLALADQENPAVWQTRGRAFEAKGDVAKARESYDHARSMNILPTFEYVFARSAGRDTARAADHR